MKIRNDYNAVSTLLREITPRNNIHTVGPAFRLNTSIFKYLLGKLDIYENKLLLSMLRGQSALL